jgi:hypothetical protein
MMSVWAIGRWVHETDFTKKKKKKERRKEEFFTIVDSLARVFLMTYLIPILDPQVSGSAFRITSKRAYHHGTMLISSNLAQLKGALRPTPNMASFLSSQHPSWHTTLFR